MIETAMQNIKNDTPIETESSHLANIIRTEADDVAIETNKIWLQQTEKMDVENGANNNELFLPSSSDNYLQNFGRDGAKFDLFTYLRDVSCFKRWNEKSTN